MQKSDEFVYKIMNPELLFYVICHQNQTKVGLAYSQKGPLIAFFFYKLLLKTAAYELVCC